MKKLFLMALALPMFMLSSCSDDEKGTVLTNTVWESTEEYNGQITARWTLKFQESTFSMDVETDSDLDGELEYEMTGTGTYTVDGNNVRLSAEGMVQDGTFTDNVMHFPEGEVNDEFTFYKK